MRARAALFLFFLSCARAPVGPAASPARPPTPSRPAAPSLLAILRDGATRHAVLLDGDEPYPLRLDEADDRLVRHGLDARLRVVGVAEERGDHARVVLEDELARVLVWVPRAALVPTVAREVRLMGGAVRARPGVRVAGDRLTDGKLRVDAAPPADAVVVAWDGAAPPPFTWPLDWRELAPGTLIRGWGHRPVATTIAPVRVRVLSRRGSSVLIETFDSPLRVRGTVPAGSFRSGRPMVRIGRARGQEVAPAGACLFDPVTDELAGILLVDSDAPPYGLVAHADGAAWQMCE